MLSGFSPARLKNFGNSFFSKLYACSKLLHHFFPNSLSKVITNIIIQGTEEKIFSCDYPEEYAQILLSVFTFLLDPGIFTWTPEQRTTKLKALADILEKGLNCPIGSFSFLYN